VSGESFIQTRFYKIQLDLGVNKTGLTPKPDRVLSGISKTGRVPVKLNPFTRTRCNSDSLMSSLTSANRVNPLS